MIIIEENFFYNNNNKTKNCVLVSVNTVITLFLVLNHMKLKKTKKNERNKKKWYGTSSRSVKPSQTWKWTVRKYSEVMNVHKKNDWRRLDADALFNLYSFLFFIHTVLKTKTKKLLRLFSVVEFSNWRWFVLLHVYINGIIIYKFMVNCSLNMRPLFICEIFGSFAIVPASSCNFGFRHESGSEIEKESNNKIKRDEILASRQAITAP